MRIVKKIIKYILGKFNYTVVRKQAESQDNNYSKNDEDPVINYLHIQCDVRELFFQQRKNDKFNRYDIVVRYLAIENYYGKNDFGFDLYEKMQIDRVGESSVESFKKLLFSYEKNGYDSSSEIELYSDLHLFDGSHRIAIALYNGAEYKISCKVRSDKADIFYGIEWFIEKGFSTQSIKIIQQKYEQISNSIMIPFACTLWSPVQEYFDEITEKLLYVAKVMKYNDYTFDEHTYSAMLKGIYSVDDIDQWKIDIKVSKMKSNSIFKMRFILLNIENPTFRLKASNNNTLSSACEVIKRIIRNSYQDKIDNYFYDIIMHIGDNFYQNTFINNLFNISIDVKEALERIIKYSYVITKFNVPYMPDNFPEKFPLNKDLDIICKEGDYQNIKDAIHSFLLKYQSGFNINLVTKYNISGREYRTLIRCELNSYLIFQFDISYQIEGIDDVFISEMIDNRYAKKNYFLPSVEHEIIIRLLEIKNYPKKTHHFDFVKSHTDFLNENLCNKYLNFDWKETIRIAV
jgi:hypothetical protein